MPLVDIASGVHESKAYLTILLERLQACQQINCITIVTNDAIFPDLSDWAKGVTHVGVSFRLISDGTLNPENRKGPMGDVVYAMKTAKIDDDMLIVGGDNWFAYDLGFFVAASRERSPAILVTRTSAKHLDPSRFGWVSASENGRVTVFLEKPTAVVPTGFRKASCVYFLAKDQLKLVEEFVSEVSPLSSPGTFFAWLSSRVATYAVEAPASWYDIGHFGRTRLSGPDFIRFRDIVRHQVHPIHSTWQRQAGEKLQWVTCIGDLVDALEDSDANVRIVSLMAIGQADALIAPVERMGIVQALLKCLQDGAQNQISYAGSEADEDTAYYVSATAADVLVALRYADSATEVFQKARAAGIQVRESRNSP